MALQCAPGLPPVVRCSCWHREATLSQEAAAHSQRADLANTDQPQGAAAPRESFKFYKRPFEVRLLVRGRNVNLASMIFPCRKRRCPGPRNRAPCWHPAAAACACPS